MSWLSIVSSYNRVLCSLKAVKESFQHVAALVRRTVCQVDAISKQGTSSRGGRRESRICAYPAESEEEQDRYKSYG